LIEVGQDGALIVAGMAAVAAVAWGANLSVRSATRGPAWALGHLSEAMRYLVGGFLVGAVVTFLIRPPWAGLAVTYVAAMVWFLATMLRRNLIRVEAAGGFVDVPAERRAQIVTTARRFLYLGALLLGAAGLAAGTQSGPAAWVTLAMALVLAGTAWGLRGAEDEAS